MHPPLAKMASSTWSLQMEQVGKQVAPDTTIQITPPKHYNWSAPDIVTCLCCRKKRPATSMDADGCGICEECLAP